MPKVVGEHAFVTPSCNARIVLGKHEKFGVYIEAYASQDPKLQWKGAMACWYQEGERSQGLTYLPEGPLLLPVLKFMEKLEFPKEDIMAVKHLLVEWGMVEMRAGEATQSAIF
jgi:hypothetical protein